ncbi:radical SAM protein [Sulfurimonas sp.]
MEQMIPNNIAYRIYDNTLAIIMNVQENKVVLLQSEPLKLWLQILRDSKNSFTEEESKILIKLKENGLIQSDTDTTTKPNTTNNIQNIDISVVNYWAFKNHIPISGHFELTSRCNLRCSHCYTLFNKKDTLSTKQIFDIIDQMHMSGTLGLVLTGGEIFAREDIVDILRYLYEKKFVLRLNTNGVYIDKDMVENIKDFTNIYRIHISLYSSEPKIHDEITNQKGSFDKTLNAIKLLKEAGFTLRINCSLMQANKDTYKEIKTEIGDKLGVNVHYDPFIYPKDDGSFNNMFDTFSDEQMQEFDIFNETNLKDDIIKKPKLCKAGYSFFSITEDGGLYPCLKMKRCYTNPLGNLTDTSFYDIWHNSDSIKMIRASLDNKIRDCSVCDLKI